MKWQDKVHALALDHLYMVDEAPAEIAPHLLWQAPFAIAACDESWPERVRRAGELWLVNYDMRPYNELVIAHVARPWFMAFQRAARPDEGHILVGPIEARVLRPSDGIALRGFPLCYREAEQAASRELWRQLARR